MKARALAVILVTLAAVACSAPTPPPTPTALQLLWTRVNAMTTCTELNPEMLLAVSRDEISVVLDRMNDLDLDCSW